MRPSGCTVDARALASYAASGGGADVGRTAFAWEEMRMNLEALPWKDMTTIALAALGAGLGVMNTWNALSQRRVRLVVRPTYAIDPRTPKDPRRVH